MMRCRLLLQIEESAALEKLKPHKLLERADTGDDPDLAGKSTLNKEESEREREKDREWLSHQTVRIFMCSLKQLPYLSC